MSTFRFTGSHADTLANGRPVAPGEFVELSDEDIREPHNERLAADGLLIGVEGEAEHQQKLASSRVSRRETRREGSNEGEES